ncbi:MAG: type II toxin-antitoxin system VapC family toxin [Thermomicrobiales bacterium]
MAAFFFDTPVLVRRYDVTEPGAARIKAICDPVMGNEIVVAQLALGEVASAFRRKIREGIFNAPNLRQTWDLFQIHWREQYEVVNLSNAICHLAERLRFAHSLKSYDAVHPSTALIVAGVSREPDMVFCTADKQQASVARREGLGVELIP